MITSSAPGKLMLFGEHAVIYGYPCITTAVSKRLTVTIEKTKTFSLETPEAHDTRFIDGVFEALGIPQTGVRLVTKSDFSGKYGFGSSSAVTVATVKALATFFKKEMNDKKLFDVAYRAVTSVQGAGSGFDVASAVFGGTLYFVKGGTVIEPLKVSGIPLVVGYTGVKADTKMLIADVAAKRERNPEKVDRIFQAIAKIVEDAKVKMLEGDWERVGRLMDFNHEYLRDLGVSSQKLEAFISAAKAAGAWGAKLSGAGSGDCMIALAPPGKRKAIEDAIIDVGGEVVRVEANSPGVRVETSDDQSELFIVVDRDDKVLGYKSRYECHHDKSLIHRSVGSLIFDTDGRVLLQLRSPSKDTRPGFWADSVGGHVTKGESYDEAIRREVREELGVDIPMRLHSKYIFSLENETEMDALYIGTHNGPFLTNPEETERVEFVSKNELPGKLLSGEITLTEFAHDALKKVGFLS